MSVENWDNLAFEGAQGFGAGATGGRGGEVVMVTSLEDSGVGSLRWALEDLDDPRIVVFAVGGQIDLHKDIHINGDVTLAGQTAPEGITVTGARLRVVESNVIIRGMNVRPGDARDGHKPENRDGISVGKGGNTVKDVIIDSNSITWALDENASTWNSPSNVTWSNNIIAEGLMDSIHPKGEHSMGMLIGDGSKKISIVGNLFASNDQRNAIIKDGSEYVEFINNVVYNYGRQGLQVTGGSVNAIGNVMIAGDDSNGRPAIRFDSGAGSQKYYESDNLSAIGGNATGRLKSGLAFASGTDEIMPSDEVLDWVTDHVGVIIEGSRSKIDQRIVNSVLNDKGEIIDSPRDVGGYVDSKTTSALRDSDGDGIPNIYETRIGSDANTPDAMEDADGDGLANIEDYINGLIDGFGEAPASRPTTSTSTNTTTTSQSASSSGTSTSSGSAAREVTIEAEDFELIKGFQVERLMAASDGKIVKARGDAEASAIFDGTSGTYDLDLTYFDENDGVSYLEVQLNGEVLDAWHWNADLGSRLANWTTKTHHVIEQIDLEAGDEIVLLGTGARSYEPLRIDALTFTPSDTVLG